MSNTSMNRPDNIWGHPPKPKMSGKKKAVVWGGGCLGALVIFLITMAGCGALIAAVEEETKADFTVTASPTTSTLSDADKARIKANEEAEAKAAAEAEAAAKAAAEAQAAEEAKKKAEEDASAKEEAAQTILTVTWEQVSKEDRELMCVGYNLDSDVMWDSFNAGQDGDWVTRKQFDDFFRQKC